MVTRQVFTVLVGLLALQRLYELRRSTRNEAILHARGAHEFAAWQLTAMKALHAGWFASMLVEVHILRRPFRPGLSLPALLALIAGQSLRYAAIHALGWRWTTKVLTLPGRPLVQMGIYRYLRHPNYLGVGLEILAVPLLHSAYITAAAFSLANLILLSERIRTENGALRAAVNG